MGDPEGTQTGESSAAFKHWGLPVLPSPFYLASWLSLEVGSMEHHV